MHPPPPQPSPLSLHDALPIFPITTRAAISQASLWAAPPSADIRAKIAAPRKKALRRPNMSASRPPVTIITPRSEEHTSELQSRRDLVCRLLLEKKKKIKKKTS